MGEAVAFLGLGTMGHPMAGHLARAGHRVTVFNRTHARAEAWQREYGGSRAATPAEAARGARFVFCCVGRDADLREVTLGPQGAFASLEAGAVFVDHTTASPGIARELYAAARARGAGFLDAPVSGGQSGAQQGRLSVMVGGDAEDFERARPLLECYSLAVRLLGPPGSGQLAKLVNQICIAGTLQGLAEGLHFARAAGLDARAAMEVIAQGAAQSWQLDHRHASMLEGRYDFGFAVEWMRKDLGLALAEAATSGASLPLTALVDQFYAEVERLGGKRWDTSSLLARLEAAGSPEPR